jgi:hypothetical protein
MIRVRRRRWRLTGVEELRGALSVKPSSRVPHVNADRDGGTRSRPVEKGVFISVGGRQLGSVIYEVYLVA